MSNTPKNCPNCGDDLMTVDVAHDSHPTYNCPKCRATFHNCVDIFGRDTIRVDGPVFNSQGCLWCLKKRMANSVY